MLQKELPRAPAPRPPPPSCCRVPQPVGAAARRRLAEAFPGVPVLPLGSAGLRELRRLVAPGRTLALLGADDAGLVEALGVPVRTVDGHEEAFKITTPVDLLLAEAVLSAR